MAEAKVPATITYKVAGTQPPIYIAGSFSSPEWVPQEMEYTTDEDGEHTFKKELKVEPGAKFQYKFRVGEGDWWIVNEDAPTVTDESGNRNNLLEAPATPGDLKLDMDIKPESGVKIKAPTDEKPDVKEEPETEARPTETTTELAKGNLRTPVTLLQESEAASRSGASTPGFVRTAAEVADSAALLDQEEPEPEITDEEAGRLGVRRLSLTPIPQVAMTAAEVADTARTLDKDDLKFDLVATPVTYHSLADVRSDMRDDSLDLPGETQERVPLFAHECIGLYEDDEIPGVQDHDDPEELLEDPLFDVGDVDLNDPTIEKFPSNRDQIMDTVRKMETGLNEDQTHFEGVPPSPVVSARSNSVTDLPGDFSASPAGSPVMARVNHHRLDVPKRGPRGSLSSERSSSVLSLDSIAEDAEEREAEHSAALEIAPLAEQAASAEEAINMAKDIEGEVSLEAGSPDESPTPVIRMPSPALKPVSAAKSLDSDEDEAVVLRGSENRGSKGTDGRSGYLTPERAASPRPEEPGSPTEPAPNTAAPIAGIETQDFDQPEQRERRGSTVIVPENQDSHSPKVVVHSAESDGLGSTTEGDQDSSKSSSIPGDDVGDESNTRTIKTDAGTATRLKKRNATAPIDRTGTPSSLSEAAKRGNWFQSFFRLIFVDWIGGFIGKLFATRRKTLLSAGTAVVVLGVAWWKARYQEG